MPKELDDMRAILRNIWEFDSTSSTHEDGQRTKYYQENEERAAAQATSLSLEEFLSSLKLEVAFAPLDHESITRAAQLTQRVTQFNLNGQRFTESELRRLKKGIKSDVIQAADRFGDLGIVGIMLSESIQSKLFIRALYLSCRALGRGIETELCRHIVRIADDALAADICFDFTETERNKPAHEFVVDFASRLTEWRSVVHNPDLYSYRVV
jgi:FkbH-like protein